MFNNLGSGTLVSDLTNNVRFPGAPDSLVALTNFAAPANVADNYGSRIRALLVPSVTSAIGAKTSIGSTKPEPFLPASFIFCFFNFCQKSAIIRYPTTFRKI